MSQIERSRSGYDTHGDYPADAKRRGAVGYVVWRDLNGYVDAVEYFFHGEEVPERARDKFHAV